MPLRYGGNCTAGADSYITCAKLSGMTVKAGTKTVLLHMPPDLHELIDKHAGEIGVSRSAVMRFSIEQALKSDLIFRFRAPMNREKVREIGRKRFQDNPDWFSLHDHNAPYAPPTSPEFHARRRLEVKAGLHQLIFEALVARGIIEDE